MRKGTAYHASRITHHHDGAIVVENAVSSTSSRVRERAPGRLPDGLRLAALVGALVALGAGAGTLSPQVRLPSERAAQNGAGWEARRLVAQMLWLKTHAVMHAGVEERAARAGEEQSRAEEIRQ